MLSYVMCLVSVARLECLVTLWGNGARAARRGCFRLKRFRYELTRETAGQEDPEKFSLHPIRKVQNFLNFTPSP